MYARCKFDHWTRQAQLNKHKQNDGVNAFPQQHERFSRADGKSKWAKTLFDRTVFIQSEYRWAVLQSADCAVQLPHNIWIDWKYFGGVGSCEEQADANCQVNMFKSFLMCKKSFLKLKKLKQNRINFYEKKKNFCVNGLSWSFDKRKLLELNGSKEYFSVIIWVEIWKSELQIKQNKKSLVSLFKISGRFKNLTIFGVIGFLLKKICGKKPSVSLNARLSLQNIDSNH